MDYQFTSHSATETMTLGWRLSQDLKQGDVVLFMGDLAAGKTTMIKGVCSGLDVAQDLVGSPTYTLVNEYPGKVPIYHVDCYRENNIEGWLEIGINDYLYGNGIVLIEWADRIKAILPAEAMAVYLLQNTARQSQRSIKIKSKRKLNHLELPREQLKTPHF